MNEKSIRSIGKIGYAFDDVLLIPKKSTISTRKLIDTRTYFSKNIKLNIPIVSANMDAVTEAPMAITMASLGGMGIIHRFMSVEQQVDQVQQVKRSEGIMIEQPITIKPEGSIFQVNLKN